MDVKFKWPYTVGPLINNVNHLIKKVEKGYFNILLIFGPTRSGKSTIAMQVADYMAQNLGVPFSDKFVYFDAVQLEKECSGKQRQIFILDEAAFDLTGEDWAKDAQKRLKTYFSVAAKYNQTFILIIPHIEELRKYFVINEHTRGMEVRFNERTLERGWVKLYGKPELRAIYYYRKLNHYSKAGAVFGFYHRFPKRLPPSINIEEYNKRKDDAIQTKEDSNDKNSKAQFIQNGLNLGIDAKTLATILNTTRQYVYMVKNDRPINK